jgi:hypothetical protein
MQQGCSSQGVDGISDAKPLLRGGPRGRAKAIVAALLNEDTSGRGEPLRMKHQSTLDEPLSASATPDNHIGKRGSR